jgi:hypothetical protein
MVSHIFSFFFVREIYHGLLYFLVFICKGDLPWSPAYRTETVLEEQPNLTAQQSTPSIWEP